MFSQEQQDKLNQELPNNRIKTRQKGNISLSYLEGFDIIQTANDIFGFGNWDYSISKLELVSQEVNQNQNHVICYKAVINITVYDTQHSKSISREDVGFGSGIAKTLADAHEGAAKEAVTDAIKRTLRSFGNQFGNSLYNKDKNNNNQSNQQNNNQNFQQPVQQNYSQNNTTTFQQPYKHQQDFNQLTTLGLTVVQQNDNLIVVGENVFENKEAIKRNGFRWDGHNKSWYMPLRQAA